MEPDAGRVKSLELRIAELERRLAAVESARPAPVAAVEPARPAPMPAQPPPPVVAKPPSLSRGPDGRLWASPIPDGYRWEPQAGPAAATSASGPDAADPSDSTEAWSLSLRDLEDRFAGRALAIVGGLALVAAAIFFLSLAFSRGWVTEPMRVAIGLASGSGAFAAGGWRLSRRDPLLGTVLAGVGIGVLEIALFAATGLYALVPPEVGLACALVVAVVAAVVAIRFDAPVVAAYGLVAALAAPPLVGAEPTLVTLGFLAIVLAGTTAIALFRTWPWLPAIAFLLTAPQLASWLVGDADTAPALVALVGFWLVNLVAAAGEEVRVRRDDLRPSSAGLVVADAAFLLWGGLVVLSGPLEPWRGLFVLLAAGAHLAIGWWFLERQGWQHLFGTLVAGTGAALLAIAALVQLEAPVVTGAWGAEAVALAWLAVRRRHRWSAVAAGAMLGLALAQVAVQYLLATLGGGLDAFPNAELFALGTVLLATGAVGWLVPIRSIRSLLVAAGIAIVGWAIGFQADGAPAIVLWAALLPIAVAADRVLAGLPDDADLRASWTLGIPELGVGSPATLAGIAAWVVAAAEALTHQLNPATWGSVTPPAVPLTDERALVAAALTATLILAGAIVQQPFLRTGAAVLAIVVPVIVAPFEVYADLVVVAWVGLAVAAVAYVGWDRRALVPMTWLACALVAGAALVTFTIVAPPSRLVVVDPAFVHQPPLLPLWPLSFAALAAVLLASPRHRPVAPWAAGLQVAGAAVAMYGVSVAVVAGFQRLVGGPVPVAELGTQAQVALSVTWTTIGVVGLGVGLARRRPLVRQAALGLLALATAKVFVVDLAAMDVAYRAVVLAGLGGLLLLGAWVVTRFHGPRGNGSDAAEKPEVAT